MCTRVAVGCVKLVRTGTAGPQPKKHVQLYSTLSWHTSRNSIMSYVNKDHILGNV